MKGGIFIAVGLAGIICFARLTHSAKFVAPEKTENQGSSQQPSGQSGQQPSQHPVVINPGTPQQLFPGGPFGPSHPGVFWPPYPPPQQSCDVCSKLSYGFSKTFAYLQAIDQKVTGCHGACPSGIDVVVGPNSGVADDDFSQAACPAGYTVVGCRCSLDDQTCDGVKVAGEVCTAFKSAFNPVPIQAIATCTPTNTDTYSIITAGPLPNPAAVCPSGTKLIACWLHSYWQNNVQGISLFLSGSNMCAVSQVCSVGSGCDIQALCKTL